MASSKAHRATALNLDARGEGHDPGDKAGYKAWTGAYKYGPRSLLQLPFGDDPEATSCAETSPDRPMEVPPQAQEAAPRSS